MARSTVVRHETAVGAFVMLTVALMAGTLIIKGARTGIGARTISFMADEGHDLKKGATVKMQGIEVGEVSDVVLDKENQVRVRLKIYPEFCDNIRDDAKASINEPPLLGSTTVEITSGTVGNKPIQDGKTELKQVDKKGIMENVHGAADELQRIVDRVNKIADRADSTLTTVNKIVDKVNAGQGLVGRLVNDEKLADEFVSTVKDARSVLDDMKAGRGAFALLKDEQLAPDIKATIADVRSITDAVSRGDGAFGRLMTNNTLTIEAEGVLHDVRGALARLEEITKDATSTTSKVGGVLDSAKATLDKLDGTIKNTEKVTGELAQMTEKVNKGQGTLAKLVNDDAIYKETKALLKELRESVEDLREQAPINSFIGVVFSAF